MPVCAVRSQAFHARGSKLRMRRNSAPSNEVMVMCGMRVPRSGTSNAGSCLRYGRYVGDEGGCWGGRHRGCVWPCVPCVAGLCWACVQLQWASRERPWDSSHLFMTPPCCFPPSPHMCVCVAHTGPEADQFSLSSWPDLARTGGFKAISDLWTAQLPVGGDKMLRTDAVFVCLVC